MGIVTGLRPFTVYSCTIFAVTVANGPMSDPPVVVTTAEARKGINQLMYNNLYDYSIAPSPIIINSVTGINTSTVRVTWTTPDLLNGILISYTIVYTVEGVSQPTTVTVNYNGEPVSLYISYKHCYIISYTTDTII